MNVANGPERTRGVAFTGLTLGAVALIVFIAFLWLGHYVSAHGEPPLLLAFAHHVRGKAVAAALFFTATGRGFVLGPLYAVAVTAGIARRAWRVRALLSVASGLACWGLADAFQHYFARPRRPDWVVFHEHAFSYPSSHAAIATGFFFLIGLFVLQSSARQWIRYGGFAFFTCFALAVAWSRLALAAHYPTDVLGGMLLGLSVIFAGAAAIRTFAPGALA